MIKTKFGIENLSFEFFIEKMVANAIKNLPTGKGSVSKCFYYDYLKNNFFPDMLINAELTPF